MDINTVNILLGIKGDTEFIKGKLEGKLGEFDARIKALEDRTRSVENFDRWKSLLNSGVIGLVATTVVGLAHFVARKFFHWDV